MGNFISTCGAKEYEMKIEQLEVLIHSTQNKLKQSENTVEKLKKENLTACQKIATAGTENQILKDIIDHHDLILGSGIHIAEEIINGELNCKWMDDKKEKEYLISIVRFLHTICGDTTYTFKKTAKKPEKKKKNNLDKLMIELSDECDIQSLTDDSSYSN